jgi:Domain of unknown function (DUF4124)
VLTGLSRVLAVAGFSALACAAATAQSGKNKLYKYTDEKGNVVYSQTPPMNGAKAEKLDARPAYTGRGGDSRTHSPYDNPGLYSNDDVRQRHETAAQRRQEQQQATRQKRQADLEARCNRNRGTDCKDPETLRYMESTQIPGGRYRAPQTR